MANKCAICGKGPKTGNKISHSEKKTKRRWLPNLHNAKIMFNGSPKRIRVCTKCLKSAKVEKAL